MRDSERRDWASFADRRAAGFSIAPRPIQPKKSKYRNVRTIVDGHKFHSKLEADRYCELKLLQKAGEILYFLRQVPFDLAGGVIYRCDFLVVSTSGIEVEDTKGYISEVSRIKIAAVEERYGIRVKILTRREVK